MKVEGLFIQFCPLFLRSVGLVAILPLSSGAFFSIEKFLLSAGLGALLLGWVPVNLGYNCLDLTLEFVLGVIVGLPCALVIQGAKMLGALFDTGRGEDMGSLYDPFFEGTGAHSSILAQSYVWVVLLISGVLESQVKALVQSFKVIAGGGVSVSDLESVAYKGSIFTATVFGKILILFLPVAILFLGIDLAVGFITKSAPRISLDREGFKIKTILGFLLLMVLARFDISGRLLGFVNNVSLFNI